MKIKKIDTLFFDYTVSSIKYDIDYLSTTPEFFRLI